MLVAITPHSRTDFKKPVPISKFFLVSISYADLLNILFTISIALLTKLFLTPNVLISLIPLIDSLVKDINLSCSFFLSLCIFSNIGLYFFIIKYNIIIQTIISKPIIQEFINMYISTTNDVTKTVTIFNNLKNTKLNVLASFVIRLIISPEDIFSNATAGRLRAF
ncbi:unknown [Clostridium sp. CAG:524]|nr:unknown [Clostridium sp. CAG:524]